MPELSIEEARAAMIAKRFGGNAAGARTGGEGTVRRKTKGAHKSGGDDKKISAVLKKMNMNPIQGVEEVNIFQNTGEVIQIVNPKIQAQVQSNTFVVSGHAETKQLTDLLPGILNQIGPESMERLRKYAESIGMTGAGGAGGAEEEEEDDDEVPELVENFEEAANK